MITINFDTVESRALVHKMESVLPRLYTEDEIVDIVRCYGEDYHNTSRDVILGGVNEYLEDLNTPI